MSCSVVLPLTPNESLKVGLQKKKQESWRAPALLALLTCVALGALALWRANSQGLATSSKVDSSTTHPTEKLPKKVYKRPLSLPERVVTTEGKAADTSSEISCFSGFFENLPYEAIEREFSYQVLNGRTLDKTLLYKGAIKKKNQPPYLLIAKTNLYQKMPPSRHLVFLI